MTHSSLHDCFGFHLRSLSHGVVGPTPQTASPPWCRAHREQHPFVPSNSAHPCCAASPMSFQKFGENPFSVGKIKMPPSSKSHLQNKATLLRNVMTALVPLKSQPNCPSCGLHRCSSECPPASRYSSDSCDLYSPLQNTFSSNISSKCCSLSKRLPSYYSQASWDALFTVRPFTSSRSFKISLGVEKIKEWYS